MGFFGVFPEIRDFGLPGNRGAPARGVDVKPPSRRGPGSGKDPKSGIWGFLGPSGGLGDLPGRPGDPSRGPEDPPDGSGDPAGRGFYINPSRRGPAVPAGPGPGDRGPGGSPRATRLGRSQPVGAPPAWMGRDSQRSASLPQGVTVKVE